MTARAACSLNIASRPRAAGKSVPSGELPGGPQLTELTKLEDTVPYVRFTAVPSCCIARMQTAAMNASNIAYSTRSCAASSQTSRRIQITRQDLFLHHPSRYELGLQDLLSDVSAHSADHPTQ